MVIVWAYSKEGSEAWQQSAAGTASVTLSFPLQIRHGFTCTNMCASVHMQLREYKHLCSHCCIVPLVKTTEEKHPAMATHDQPHLTCPLSLSLMLSVFEFFFSIVTEKYTICQILIFFIMFCPLCPHCPCHWHTSPSVSFL